MHEMPDLETAIRVRPDTLDGPSINPGDRSPPTNEPVRVAATTVLQVARKHFIPEPQPGVEERWRIFRTPFVAPMGRCAILAQIQIDSPPPEGAELEISLVNLATARVDADLKVALSRCDLADFDALILEAEFPSTTPVEVVGITTMSPSQIRLRHLKVVQPGDASPVSLTTFRDDSSRFQTNTLKAVFVGTTNICNANCPHCPTNKKMTAHLDRGVMSMELFEKLIRELDGIEIGDALLFGVFGEPFEDPLLEKRIKLAKRLRPELQIDIATNGALARPERVAAIIDDVRRIAIHIEAVSPELYDKLMVPLKAREVFPHVDELTRRFGSKIVVTSPLHQGNMHEVPRLKQRWSHRGTDVNFLPLQTRGTDRTLAKRVNLGAAGGFWGTDLIDILVVDWDGVVLATCDDFLRRHPLGDLNNSSIAEIMNGEARHALFESLKHHRWHELPSLRDAIVDEFDVTQRFAAIEPERDRWEIHGQQLLGSPEARKTADGIRPTSAPSQTQAAVYGPYLTLPAGRYHASFLGHAPQGAAMPRLLFEITAECGARRYAAVERSGSELHSFNVSMEFVHDRPDSGIEFRVFVLSGDASVTTLRKVQLVRLAG